MKVTEKLKVQHFCHLPNSLVSLTSDPGKGRGVEEGWREADEMAPGMPAIIELSRHEAARREGGSLARHGEAES